MVCCKSNLWLQRFAGILNIIFSVLQYDVDDIVLITTVSFFFLLTTPHLPLSPIFLLPVDLFEDLENFDEEVDDVQVQLDGGGDVVFR